MRWRQLPKSLHQPVKLIAAFTNATLPLSDWFLRSVSKTRGYIIVENPATGYVLPLSPNELIGYDDHRWSYPCFQLRVGLRFECPNAYFVYSNGLAKNVAINKSP